MKKYLISGIPPSETGVGYLMVNLEQIAYKYDYDVIYPRHVAKSLRQWQSLYNPLKVILELWNRYKRKKEFIYTINNIKDSEVVLVHPQTIGYDNLINIIKLNQTIKIYVMDNSFFCIKSYNVLNNQECLRCLNNLDDCDTSCLPSPVKYDKNKNIEYLKLYKELASKISFYSQNNKQEELLKAHFGSDINITKIGLITGEVFEKELVHSDLKYDIVYHGANHEAKGIIYTIELAKYLKKYKILIPENRGNIIYNGVLPENIIFESMSWNSGLKEAVINSKLVLNTSIWSEPVAGALLKSIYYNGNVGIPKTKYGFINDIPKGCVLTLNNNIKESAALIESYLNDNNDMSTISQEWLSKFILECNLKKLFSVE